MAFGRRSRSLAQTAARTAVITGTAVATSNAVHGRAARRQAALAPEPIAEPTPPPVPAATSVTAATPPEDVIARLERLAALHTAGALTDEEFATLKTQAIGNAAN